MKENNNEQNAQSLYDEAVRLRKEWENSFPGIVRSKLFVTYGEANSYYRNEPVRLMKSAMELAVQEKDETLEVECAYSLFQYLSCDMKDDDKKTFLTACLSSLLDCLLSKEAKGNLHYYLGNQFVKLKLSQWATDNYSAAIELDNEKVLKDTKVFWPNPDFIFIWLEKFLGDKERAGRAASFEQHYNELTLAGTKRPEYALKLATLHKDKQTGKADQYYRECITLGVPEVVDNPAFLRVEYEEEYIKWFRRSVETNGPVKAREICLDKLWNTRSVAEFSTSHQVFAETLYARSLYQEAFQEYNRCALAKLPWAKEFLLEHIEEASVRQAISDELIRLWYGETAVDDATHEALGLLFDKDKRLPELAKRLKGRLCIAARKLSESGGLQPAVGFFREAENMASEKTEKDFSAYEELVGHILNRIDDAVKRQYRNILIEQFNLEKIAFDESDAVLSLIGKPVKSTGKLADWKVSTSFKRFQGSTPADSVALQRYFQDGRLETNMFRQADDAPLYTRYLLLKQLAGLALTAYYNASESANANFQAQQDCLLAQAKQELEELISNHDYHALLATVVELLDSSASRARGSAWLYALSLAVKPEDSPLPFWLLANFWSEDQAKENLVQLLRHLLKRPDGFEKFCSLRDRLSIHRAIFELLS